MKDYLRKEEFRREIQREIRARKEERCLWIAVVILLLFVDWLVFIVVSTIGNIN